jgi:hypothetical protein
MAGGSFGGSRDRRQTRQARLAHRKRLLRADLTVAVGDQQHDPARAGTQQR